MKKFAFLFAINNRISWSGEDKASLMKRLSSEAASLRDEVAEFCDTATVGSHMSVEPYGEMIFRIQ